MTANTDAIKPGIAVRVGTLAAFLAEVPPAATIRLMQTHRRNECFRTIFLHLQALTADGEVAWLCEAHQIMCWHAERGEPAGGPDRQVSDGMQRLHGLLRQHLAGLGFTVRDGSDFGLPDTVKPISGHIGYWTRDDQGVLTVTLDTADLLSS
jgi:hypothetical protein